MHINDLRKLKTFFVHTDCYVGSEFLCQNHRCIPIQLHCGNFLRLSIVTIAIAFSIVLDGFDHCGDNSDEPDSCSAGKK